MDSIPIKPECEDLRQLKAQSATKYYRNKSLSHLFDSLVPIMSDPVLCNCKLYKNVLVV